MLESFQLIDIIIIIGICQGVFLSFTLQKIENNNRKANTILSSLIVIATLMLIGRFIFFRYLTAIVFQWSLVGDTILFIFGPLVYIYVRRLLFKIDESYFLPWTHFLPALLFLVATWIYVIFYTQAEYYVLFQEGKLTLFFNIVSILAMLLNSSYLVASFILIKRFRVSKKLVFSFDQGPISYLIYFLIAIGLCVLAWILSYANYKLFDEFFKYIDYNTVWVAIPIFIYVIGYFSLRQPELFRIPIEKENKPSKERLSLSDSNLLKEKLDTLMKNDKIFLQSDLTLVNISERLKTSTNNVSWLLNNIYETTFYDFVNNYRVKEFIRKVERREHLQHTILALSFDVGFNSKSTFNKAFKINMHETPSSYIKNLRAA